MKDISAQGLTLRLVASNTFPQGFTITSAADDADMLDIPELEICKRAMGPNGDLVTWSTPAPLDVNISIIPNTEDDINLQVLFDANKPVRGRLFNRDEITLVVLYPGGETLSMSQGRCTKYTPGLSGNSDGRFKTRQYAFTFETFSRTF